MKYQFDGLNRSLHVAEERINSNTGENTKRKKSEQNGTVNPRVWAATDGLTYMYCTLIRKGERMGVKKYMRR